MDELTSQQNALVGNIGRRIQDLKLALTSLLDHVGVYSHRDYSNVTDADFTGSGYDFVIQDFTNSIEAIEAIASLLDGGTPTAKDYGEFLDIVRLL